jgi:thiamine biosynthesis protein ThiS
MQITVNGETRDVTPDTTIGSLLHGLGLSPKVTVVQRNDDVVTRDQYDSTHLVDGDVIELVRFVGGG